MTTNRLAQYLVPIAEPSTLVRLAIGVGIAVAAVLLRALLDPLLGDGAPWMTFFAAALLAALVAGARAGALCVATCTLLGVLLFVSPRGTLEIDAAEDVASLLAFIVNATLLAAVGATLRRAVQALRRHTEEAEAAARALAASERRFRSLADAAPAMLWVTDTEGRRTFLSRGWCDFSGQREAAGLGDAWLATVHPDDAGRAAAALRTALEQRQPFSLDYRMRDAAGAYRWVMSSGRPRMADDGTFAGFVGSLVDISERKRAEQLLQEQEERLRQTVAELELVTDRMAAAVTRCSKDYRYLWVSRQYADWVGVPAEDITGRPFVDLIGEESCRKLDPYFRRVLGGERVEYEMELDLPHRGRRWVSGAYVPTYAPDGSVDGWIAALVDVTDRKRTEQALRASEEALRARERELALQVDELTALHEFGQRIVGTADAGTVLRNVLDASIAVQHADSGFIELYDRGQHRLVPGISVGHDLAVFRRIADVPVAEGHGACGTAAARRARVVVEDVETDPIFAPYREAAREAGFRAVWSTPLLTTQGDLVGVLSTHFPTVHRPSEREVHLVELYARLAADALAAAQLRQRAEDARREAEQALEIVRESERRKDEFLAMLAHELRNPLAPMRNAVAVMRTLAPQATPLQRARDIVDRQLTHLTRLVDDLLEVSRISRGKIVLEREVLPLSQIVADAIETARPLIEQHEHTLSVMLGADDIQIDGDRARLVQVVANLLTNAAKFTPRSGHITVNTARAGSDAVVTVRDTGVGVPAELQARIFEPFAQEESTLARSQGGLGIGLTLVKRLVELHGGSVTMASDGRGTGSAFTVRVPALARTVPATADPGHAARPATAGALRILIVEDNPDAAESFQMVLSLGGHDVRVAHHGVQALRMLDEFEPDVAFIDVGLPEMTGFEVAKRLRADPRTRDIVLAALTGYGSESDKAESRRAGFDHHFTKPVDLDVVAALLSALGSSIVGPEGPSQLIH